MINRQVKFTCFFFTKYLFNVIIEITFNKSTKEVVDNVSDAENCNSNNLDDNLINNENASFLNGTKIETNYYFLFVILKF